MQHNWEGFALETHQAIQAVLSQTNPESTLKKREFSTELDIPTDYTGHNKIVQTQVRIGQNFFRKAVLSSYNWQCCITGLTLPRLLVASHIIPWRDDSSNRLNPKNGLALSMLHDKAFDIGLITINENMTIRVSRKELIIEDDFYATALLTKVS